VSLFSEISTIRALPLLSICVNLVMVYLQKLIYMFRALMSMTRVVWSGHREFGILGEAAIFCFLLFAFYFLIELLVSKW
jgi:hypothetical protein